MFPLLRLDRVSLDEVLRNLNPIELFNLSLCSKTSLLNVKNLIRRADKNCFLAISIASNCSVDVYDVKRDEPKIKSSFIVYGTEQLRFQNENQSKSVINGFQFTGLIFEDEMDTYWENEDLGFKELIEYIEDLYGKCARLSFTGDNQTKLFQMIDWAKNRQKLIIYANLRLTSVNNDDEIANILNQLKIFKKLQLEMTPSEDFIKNDHRTYEFEFVAFIGANWFNLQRLLSVKCPIIVAVQTCLTNADINLFIKFWMQGLNPTLEEIELEVNDLDLSIILSDIPHFKRAGIAKFGDQRFPTDFNVRRNDGKVAAIGEISPATEQNEAINFWMRVRPP